MDGIREFLEAVRQHGLVPGHLRGLFHVAIGRRVTRADGTVVSAGVTWRELSALFKDLRFDKELVRELGADPDVLSPRDRQRMWYAAITLAQVNAREAVAQADALARAVGPLGYAIGPPPTEPPPPPPPANPSTPPAARPRRPRK